MKILVTLLTVIGLLTLTSCTQDTDVNTMMHNNGGSYYWGMHMGWWLFALLIVIVLLVLVFNSTKRK
ncbi:MAG: hypothetical protein CVU01_02480 [Bacteroidetes bacterium HGW-Bacteroidetes-18]|nr:MAG: hypothetical protein CVU01_02480 [Bacteroidetes bacterium HGW-Bacteroidetes-18]